MRPVTVVVTGIGVSAPIVIDQYIAPANIGLGAKLSATATYKVQHTFDDPFDPNFVPASAKWYDHPTMSGSTDLDGNYSNPPRAIRLNVSASTGTVTLTVVQAGRAGGE